MITMYGIPNCDTIKKAKAWLTQHNLEFTFHDYRKDGIDADMVTNFCQLFGWEALLNKRGTTYRQLSDAQKAELNQDTAVALLVEHPAMIKRPILLSDKANLIGFKDADYQALIIKL